MIACVKYNNKHHPLIFIGTAQYFNIYGETIAAHFECADAFSRTLKMSGSQAVARPEITMRTSR